jgi:phytoene dehydrogenase-like protein
MRLPLGHSRCSAVERRYLELGGQIRYGARVEKVLVQDRRTLGVRLAGGQELRAGRVVSAADGYTTEGWLLTPRTLTMKIRKTLPGLKGFHRVGQWVEPGGGLPTVAQSGRGLVQLLCRENGKRFTTCMPVTLPR